MRRTVISITLVMLMGLFVLLPGCQTAGLSGVITESKKFTDFTYVDITGTFEVEIVQSDLFNVIIIADEKLFDYVTVDKEGETLRIYVSPRHTFTDFTVQAKVLQARITMPALYGLNLSGASQGSISGFKSSGDFSLKVSGASSINIEETEMGAALLEVTGASKVTGNKMKASNATFEISGASKIELQGSASYLGLNASGASELNLADFLLDSANIKLSGASKVTINAKNKLDAVLDDASTLYFVGNPTLGKINVSGASTIKNK